MVVGVEANLVIALAEPEPSLRQAEQLLVVPMGVLSPGPAHARPSAQPPIDMSRNFPPHVSSELPSYIYPNCLELISNVSEISKISPSIDGGLSGGSRVCRPRSEDPHRRERKFMNIVHLGQS